MTDDRVRQLARRRLCPGTGTDVENAWRRCRCCRNRSTRWWPAIPAIARPGWCWSRPTSRDPSTEEVIAPPPLGRMGERLQQLAALAPEQRPLDLYAALAEVAR